jgi:integrase
LRKRTGTIQQRGELSFRIRYVNADGIRQAETIKGTIEDAERELASRLGKVADGLPVSSKPNTVLFGELADDVLVDYEVNNFRSVSDIEARFRVHIVPIFGKRRASQITTAHIRAYTLRRQKEGAKNGTINRELEAIKHVFQFAIKGQKLHHRPHVPLLKEDNVRTGFFTREEVRRVTSHLTEPVAGFVWFGFLTGWRYGEIQQLKWYAVDFKNGEIRLDPGSTKNGKGRTFPMTSELRTLLEKRLRIIAKAKRRRKHLPIIDLAGIFAAESVFSVGEFKKSWKTACHKAGIPCDVVPVKKGGKKGAVKVVSCSRTFHDLRRSAAKALVAQGIPERVIMQMCGWLTRSTFDRYSIVGEADLRIARDLMDHARPPAKRANVRAKNAIPEG